MVKNTEARNDESIKKVEYRMDPQKALVDVIALSERLCSYPIQGKLAYATRENFLGRIVNGYHPDATGVCLLTPNAARKLCAVQNAVALQGFGLFIFDAFRPVRAVQDFIRWFESPIASDYEQVRKQIHYPHLSKKDLPKLGYAPSSISRHSFGHVVDLSLISLKTQELLSMGTVFDFFDPDSHLDASIERIGGEALKNRSFLLETMKSFDFLSYPLEWWHFEQKGQEVDVLMDGEITTSWKNLGI